MNWKYLNSVEGGGSDSNHSNNCHFLKSPCVGFESSSTWRPRVVAQKMALWLSLFPVLNNGWAYTHYIIWPPPSFCDNGHYSYTLLAAGLQHKAAGVTFPLVRWWDWRELTDRTMMQDSWPKWKARPCLAVCWIKPTAYRELDHGNEVKVSYLTEKLVRSLSPAGCSSCYSSFLFHYSHRLLPDIYQSDPLSKKMQKMTNFL